MKKDTSSDPETKMDNRASSELMVEEETKEEGDIEMSMCADILPNCENEDQVKEAFDSNKVNF